MGMGIALSYSGLLCKKEVLKINCEDLSFNSEEERYKVKTMIVRKTGTSAVSYYLPNYMNASVTAYLSKVPTKEGRLLKNLNKQSKTHVQNMGENTVTSWPTKAAELLGISSEGYIGTCWRCTGATVMADSGS
eukprot:8618321-Ditylum_brightwellii.AAC.1